MIIVLINVYVLYSLDIMSKILNDQNGVVHVGNAKM